MSLSIFLGIFLVGIILVPNVYAQDFEVPWWADGLIDELIHTDTNFRVAFIGDQGLDSNAIAVLNLIKDEGAQMVLHQGDLDYEDNPDA